MALRGMVGKVPRGRDGGKHLTCAAAVLNSTGFRRAGQQSTGLARFWKAGNGFERGLRAFSTSLSADIRPASDEQKDSHAQSDRAMWLAEFDAARKRGSGGSAFGGSFRNGGGGSKKKKDDDDDEQYDNFHVIHQGKTITNHDEIISIVDEVIENLENDENFQKLVGGSSSDDHDKDADAGGEGGGDNDGGGKAEDGEDSFIDTAAMRKKAIEELSNLPLIDPNAKSMKPSEIVAELDKHIVGQRKAKRSVSIALRNRWRRQQLDASMRDEVSPKNILMIGSTGVGKTEIGRRLAKLAKAPFVKVEATKFTEVGFHGRDVDKIIQDLVETSINLTKQIRMDQQRAAVEKIVEEQILDLLTGNKSGEARNSFRDLLRKGELDKHNVTIDAPVANSGPGAGAGVPFEIQSNIPMNQIFASMVNVSKGMGAGAGKIKEKRKLPIGEAQKVLVDAELESRMEGSDLTRDAIQLAEQHGIVFIDEIDKICSNGESRSSADASAEGVQRDLLPLIEGSVVHTKHGNVNTDHVLFISSGAFHTASPSDLLPELQGRLPIRVELESLTEKDMYRILTEPQANLVTQQRALMATEGLDLIFEDEAVKEMARIAAQVNNTIENIGARRLHTIMERIVEEVSFHASEMVETFEQGATTDASTQSFVLTKPDEEGALPQLSITKEIVNEKIGDLLQTADLRRFIL